MKTTLAVIAIVVMCSACAMTRSEKQQVKHEATIATRVAEQVVPYLPTPANQVGEALLSIATAVLAGWNVKQHKQIKKIQETQSKLDNGKH